MDVKFRRRNTTGDELLMSPTAILMHQLDKLFGTFKAFTCNSVITISLPARVGVFVLTLTKNTETHNTRQYIPRVRNTWCIRIPMQFRSTDLAKTYLPIHTSAKQSDVVYPLGHVKTQMGRTLGPFRDKIPPVIITAASQENGH